MAKKYFWLKLKEDFFNDKRIKKLRKVAGGDTYTIIYLKLALKTLNTNGIYEYESVEENIFEELALELDEEVVDVEMTLGFLLANGLLEKDDNQDVALPYVIENLGGESASASRVRKHRELKNVEQLALQSNKEVTNGNVELEREKDIEKEIDLDIIDIFNFWNSLDIIKHSKLNAERKKLIAKAIKEYGKDNLMKFMTRYKTVLSDPDDINNYSWKLEVFLKQKNALLEFTDEGSKYINYIKNKNNKSTSNGNNKPFRFIDREVED